jgi:hypothetical protein
MIWPSPPFRRCIYRTITQQSTQREGRLRNRGKGSVTELTGGEACIEANISEGGMSLGREY